MDLPSPFRMRWLAAAKRHSDMTAGRDYATDMVMAHHALGLVTTWGETTLPCYAAAAADADPSATEGNGVFMFPHLVPAAEREIYVIGLGLRSPTEEFKQATLHAVQVLVRDFLVGRYSITFHFPPRRSPDATLRLMPCIGIVRETGALTPPAGHLNLPQNDALLGGGTVVGHDPFVLDAALRMGRP
eukprot:NODE_1871_length_875_cov_266.209443_g1305_i0.p2 GENE.NODE_1871_length_875_cov_266.209443_g1305_i0~~NODE_1871_length_875_cov_266.209443_g1305_i0.p2  ORF type:complete len:187 (+),score=62.60 NODE_1871_length_875_cov_266.209443_g1305_i0:90-650(+)